VFVDGGGGAVDFQIAVCNGRHRVRNVRRAAGGGATSQYQQLQSKDKAR
jgi:hypothetical protein